MKAAASEERQVRLQWDSDEQWAAVSRATQLDAHYRSQRRRGRDTSYSRRARLRVAMWLVRRGLRMADPLTVKRMLDPG